MTEVKKATNSSSNSNKYGSKQVGLSWGVNWYDNEPQKVEVSLSDLYQRFMQPDERGTLPLGKYLVADKETQKKQKDGKWFNAATFSEGRREEFVTNVSGFTLDLDKGNVSEKMIRNKLSKYVYIASTSYSNSDEKVKWRVYIPYKVAVSKEFHYRAYHHFQNNVFPGELDLKCEYAGQIWYMPSHPRGGGEFFKCFENGIVGDDSSVELLDPTTLPKVTYVPESKVDVTTSKKPTVSNEKFDIEEVVPNGEGRRHDQLNKYTWKLLTEQKPLNEIWNMLNVYNKTHINPPHDDDEVYRVFNDASKSFEKKNSATFQKIMEKTTRLPPKKLKPLSEIMKTDYPELQWAVDGILPEGLTIIAADPKTGKSFLCYGLCIAIALGEKAFGEIDIQQGKAIYLALEDGEDRLQRRARVLFDSYGYEGDECPNLLTSVEYNRFDKGGIEDLEDALKSNPDIRLIVIDTLVQMQPASSKKNMYTDDYNSLLGLRQLASKYRVPIVVVHHLTKKTSDDPFTQITGSIGLQGCADAMIVIKRDRAQQKAILSLTGRDVEEKELLLEFNINLPGAWKIIDDAQKFSQEFDMSPTRRTILAAVSTTPMSPKEIWAALGGDTGPHSEAVVRQQLRNLLNEGLIEQPDQGLYVLPQTEENQVEATDQVEEQSDTDSETDVAVETETEVDTETADTVEVVAVEVESDTAVEVTEQEVEVDVMADVEAETDQVEQPEHNTEFDKALDEVMKHKVNKPAVTENEETVEVESETDTEYEEVEERKGFPPFYDESNSI